MSDVEDQIFELLNKTIDTDENVRMPAIQELQSYTFQLELVPKLENVLKISLQNNNISHIYFTLLILRDVIANRGVLLPLEKHQEHISHLVNIGNEFAPLISSNFAVRNVYSDSISISYRFVLETTRASPLRMPEEFIKFESTNFHKIIKANTMLSILNVVEKEMRHYKIDDQKFLESTFRQYLMIDYFIYSFLCFLSDDHTINVLGTSIFIKCANFGTTRQANQNYPQRIFTDFYQDSKYIDILLSFFMNWENSSESAQALESLSFYIKIGKTSNNNFCKSKLFDNILIDVTVKIPQIIEQITDSHNNEKAPILLLFLIDLVHFFNSSVFQFLDNFISSVINFSNQYLYNDIPNFILLWKNISTVLESPISQYNQKEKLKVVLLSIINHYLEFLLNNSGKYSEIILNNREEFLEIHSNLWIMGIPCLVEVSQNICSIVQSTLENEISEISYQKMIIVSSLLESYNKSYKALSSGASTDFSRSTFQCYNSMFSFINYESNPPEKLSSIYQEFGEAVAKFEFMFIFYSQSIINDLFRNLHMITIKQAFQNKEGLILDTIFTHLVNNLLIFNQSPNLVFSLISFFDEITNNQSMLINKHLSKNTRVQDLSHQRIQLVFDAFSFTDVKQKMPLLYKIYSNVISNEEFPLFLASLDHSFTTTLADPKQCFILFRQIRGIEMNVKNQLLKGMILKWMIQNHFTDTLNLLKQHCKVKYTVEAIVKTWTELAKLFDNQIMKTTGLGIEYFRKNVQLMLVLKEHCEEPQWSIMKIVHCCIVGDYANYGIMKLYNDKSIDIVLEHFFYLLITWANGETPKRLIRITEVLRKISEIGMAEMIFTVEQNLMGMNEFLINNLLVGDLEIWKISCDCFGKLLNEAILHSMPTQRFMQFFIITLDALINLPFNDRKTIESTAFVMFLLIKENTPQCHQVCEAVISTFEEIYISDVRKIFNSLLSAAVVEDTNPFNHYLNEVINFSNRMKKYHVEIANIPIFAQIFRRIG
ncbi:hypothetical protein TRFO_17652 [Tritrichomonas foetus]|uniref:Exportin-1 C-terminal domain-containing protein n=1 Tax=Tritrichomonas foetus TaxID=1144522 RepID=A0A1J4KSP2_9EUKA|nr:hypothetical protein TRFO_17652 [Tritrichomonas foetus]|eukprot:OHT12493.1 hypothetical protein TRFO_17652 [Tritrichomonas foetus]